MYKAVFIDMDGTLLQKDHTISDTNKQVIKKLLDKGILIIPISARPLHGILPISKQLFPDNIPVVSLNGSYIFLNNEIIYQSAVPLEDVINVQKEIAPYDVSAMYYSQMNWYAEADDQHIQKEQKITDVKIKIQPFSDTVNEWKTKNGGPNKILIAGNADLINGIEKRLIDQHGDKLNMSKSKTTYLEVMSLNSSKTKAIEFLLDRYGIKQNEIIAIGDNFNDKQMIEFAGVGVAMGNAPDEIKNVADYVTDTNNNDGVAKALNHFFE
ncbi:MAG TPA: Cof-type HAD-IIB family hydrolase [Ferruginibacter sp.]|jgi:Cof subfamily protein (haloacid dehalogenase superfamily)|nr:Cof-type HAD-IIB family hydrolase [Ferruginibacter sp.]